MLQLAYNLQFDDLYSSQGLKKLDDLWLNYLEQLSASLYQAINIARTNSLQINRLEESKLIIELAPYLEDFIANLFNIVPQVTKLTYQYNSYARIYKCKREFIQRYAIKNYNTSDFQNIFEVESQLSNLGVNVNNENSFAQFVENALKDSLLNASKLKLAAIYGAWATLTTEGQVRHANSILFKTPVKIDFTNLIKDVSVEDGIWRATQSSVRNDFSLADSSLTPLKAYDQANYCIHCHHQLKDSCSHGIKIKEEQFKINELKIKLTGCPLEEKISEMNLLKSQGSIIGALATAIIDNPMLAATGHRICNDCMKSCIYQKQEPVNIPLIETQTLDDVLSLPWGFEIYSLLTKWNPLNFANYHLKPINNYKVLVAGLGPAGFTIAHYLLNEGYTTIAIDALKIEPQPIHISGVDVFGKRHNFKPIKDIKKELFTDLNERIPQGFGGVAEYGITVRWNKNYLNVIRTMLERRANFRMHGGVRFGSTIDYNTAKDMGFDHIVLALGTGKPNLPDVPNILAKGCRMASDFLMSLQLGGAFNQSSLTNLQIRLPIIVIGGGLTAIDTATESLTYYGVQIEKFLRQYESLGEQIFANLTEEETLIANEFISHAKLLRESPSLKLELLRQWGGSKVAYRGKMQDSPAYRLNHEEVQHALKEGIEFVENITPIEILLDEYSSTYAVKHQNGIINARTVLIATGTHPNTILTKEDPIHFVLNSRYFRAVNQNGEVVEPEPISKPLSVDIILNSGKEGPSVSFLGDLHPSFAGNVVKAMASAKGAYPIISRLMSNKPKSSSIESSAFFTKLDESLIATVYQTIRLTKNIDEILVDAPLAVAKFEPGQFYRLQNYHSLSDTKGNINFDIEPLALTGAWVDKDKGLISLIVLHMGASSNFCQTLKVGDPIVLMGPTGTKTHIPHNQTVMLVGGGLGNAVLFSIGKALKKNNCKVLYFAGYRHVHDRFKVADIEQISDVVIWCCDEEILTKNRENDFSFWGNLLQGIEYYAHQPSASIKLSSIDHMIVIGSDSMMNAVAYARHNSLKHFFKNNHIAIGSINSPMQCMMKEICGQCIQRHVNPTTQQESYVYSCFNQDQLLDDVDFEHLHNRLKQNSLQEKVCNLISKKLIAQYEMRDKL